MAAYSDDFQRGLNIGLYGNDDEYRKVLEEAFNAANPKQQQDLNPQTLGFINQIVGNKAIYDAAQEMLNDNTVGEQQRQRAQELQKQAHDAADYARKVAGGVGIDLSQYGADNATYKDAQLNRDIALQKLVKKFYDEDLTPDEYYSQQYGKFMADGLSARMAQKAAARATEIYEPRRTRGLMNILQMMGLNADNSLNNFGAEIMTRGGADAPEVFNAIGNLYATPKKVYDNANSLANQKALIEQSHNYGMEDRADTYAKNKDYYGYQKGIDFEYGEKRADNASKRKIAELTQQQEMEREARKQAAYDEINLRTKLADQIGITDKDMRTQYIYGVDLSNKDKAKGKLKDLHSMLSERLKSATELAKNQMKPSQDLLSQINDLNAKLAEIENAASESFGLDLKGNGDWEIPAITDDFESNVKTAKEILQHGGTDAYIREYFGSKYKGSDLEKLIKSANS